jgi:hypothetical protein
MTSFKEALKQQTSIRSVTVSTSIPGESVGWNAGGIKLVGTDESTQKQYRVIGVDYDFMKAYDMKLIAGRVFSKDYGTDDQAVIFNRKVLEQLGFTKPAEALGKKIDFWGKQYTIAGVTENFHQQSLREAYEPLIFRLIPDVRGYISIKTNTVQAGQTIVLTANTRHVVSVQAYLPWTSVRLTRSGNTWTATVLVPATQAAGSYLVRFSGIDEDDAPCEANIELVVTSAAEGGDVEFVITD